MAQFTNIDPDKADEIYKRGWEARGEHNSPSPQTIQLITKMDMKMEKLDTQFSYLKDEVTEIKCRIVDEDKMLLLLEKAQQNVLEKADKRFASRERVGRLEKAVYGGIGALLMVLLGIVVFIVQGHIKF